MAQQDLLKMREEARARGWSGYGVLELIGPAAGTSGSGADTASGGSGGDVDSQASSGGPSGGGDRGGGGGGPVTPPNSSSVPAELKGSKKNRPLILEDLLEAMIDEAQPGLRPGFLSIDTIGRQLRMQPPRDKLIAELRARGHAAGRSHVEMRSIVTSASVGETLGACVEGLGIALRADSPFTLAAADGTD